MLIYHRVADLNTLGGLDPALVDATPEEFDRQIGILARYFTPVSIDDVIEARRGGPLPPNAALVSFDDGYLDNYENALPILKRHGMKGVFFVATDYVTDRRLYWWDVVGLVVRATKRKEIPLTYPFAGALPVVDPAEREKAVRKIIRIIKSHYALDLPRFLDELIRACDVPWSREIERGHAERAIMTWDQVRALKQAGMDVESHTRSHRVLSTLPPEAFEAELAGSRAELEQRLDAPVRAIAYPVGKSIADAPAIREQVDRAGYALGFTTEPGVIRFSAQCDHLDLRRIPIDRGISMARFRGGLALPWLA